MAVIVFMMEEIHLTYRDATANLYVHSQTLAKMGLDKVPSKSTIHRASKRMPEQCYRKIHFSVIRDMATGNMAGDSSGFSMRKFIVWFSVKKNAKIKKGWRKLHIIIDIRTRVILDYRTTHHMQGRFSRDDRDSKRDDRLPVREYWRRLL